MVVLLCKWDPIISEALTNRGQTVYLILDQFDAKTYTIPKDRFKEIFLVPDFNAIEQLGEIGAELLNCNVKPDIIISHAEFSQIGAGFLSEILAIPNFSLRCALATRDKRLMKAAARRVGLKTANIISLAGEQSAGVSLATRELGYPLILKPSNGFGTFSTKKINSEVELVSALSSVTASNNVHPLLRTAHWVAEEFIAGDEYHANAIILNGQVEFLSISQYYCPRIDAISHQRLNGAFIVEEHLSPEMYAWARKGLLAFAREIGLGVGVFHMEFFHREGEFIFSEIASRIGGGGVDLAITQRYGRSMRTMLVEALCDGELNLSTLKTPDDRVYGDINLIPMQSGKITSIPTVQELTQHPYVLDAKVFRKVGDMFMLPDHPSSWCVLVGFAIPREKDLLEELLNIRNTFTIRCEP